MTRRTTRARVLIRGRGQADTRPCAWCGHRCSYPVLPIERRSVSNGWFVPYHPACAAEMAEMVLAVANNAATEGAS